MHPALRSMAAKYGYTEEAGNFVLLDCPAEDYQALKSGLEEGLRKVKSKQAALDAVSVDSAHSNENGNQSLSVSKALDAIVPRVQVDTIISIITLCSVPKHSVLPALTNLISLLAPSPSTTANCESATSQSDSVTTSRPGIFLMYEHTMNPHSKRTRLWQRILSPIWRQSLDGCELDRDTVACIWEAGRVVARNQSEYDGKLETVWSVEESKVREMENEDIENMFWYYTGKFVKSAI